MREEDLELDSWEILSDGGEEDTDSEDGTGDDTGTATEDADAGDDTGDQTVPLSALQAVREENQQLREQLSGLSAQMQHMQDTTQTEQNVKGNGIFGDLDDDDVVTVKDTRKVMEDMNNANQANVLGLQFQLSHPDYETVINKHLPNVLKTDPYLAMAIKTSADPIRLAYTLGVTDPKYSKDKASNDADRIIKNSKKPTSPAGGGGGTEKGTVDAIMNMSKADLEAKIKAVKLKV